MLGGTLPESLPWTFPNLKHLGLAHCSAGLYAAELSWLQDPAICNSTVANDACYCSSSLYIKETTTYSLVGTIPASWGSADSPWRASITSM